MYANASIEITMGEKHNDLTEIIAQTLFEMKMEQGEKFNSIIVKKHHPA